ncbi:MAG: hypothetical protein U1E27_02325 [Kiritimatiellia bacterium]|nr:hypothetical protein [Kiritimatiellia bacterium]
MNIYAELTTRFNKGRLRAILAGGQAVVLHRLAVMSKDGDWVIRQDEETTAHILDVLQSFNARYRFGAPLDARWLGGGWSSHFEFAYDGLRVRTDFVSRPPRLCSSDLKRLWEGRDQEKIPLTPPRELAEMKKTNREKDYAVIGELARIMNRAEDQLLYSRSARDLIALAQAHPITAEALADRRPLLRVFGAGRADVEAALDAERRQLIHANEDRLIRYMTAAQKWAEAWSAVSAEVADKPLIEANRIMRARAENLLPYTVEGGLP